MLSALSEVELFPVKEQIFSPSFEEQIAHQDQARREKHGGKTNEKSKWHK